MCETRSCEHTPRLLLCASHFSLSIPAPHEQKVGTVARAAVTKVGEVNQEYKITERIGGALLSGLNYLSSSSAAYLQSRGADEAAPLAPVTASAPPAPPTYTASSSDLVQQSS